MSKRSVAVIALLIPTAFALQGSAQTIATGPLPGATVTNESALGRLQCGQAFTHNYTIKNTGSGALSTKILLNGASTPLDLAKDESKTLMVNGGAYDCTKSLGFSMSIASPTGSIKPLFSKSYAPDTIVYNAGSKSVAGGTLSINATLTCGGAPSMTFKNTGTAAVKVSGYVGTTSNTVTVEANGSKTVTFSTSTDCAATIPAVTYKDQNDGNGGTLTAQRVTFKP
jgi:hypothetical protein